MRPQVNMTETAPKSPPQGSPFWHFSLGFYRRPAVADACIKLQDEAGVDVNLLFFLLWNASLQRRLSVADVAAIDRQVAEWREMAVIPLRTLRRALKSPPPMIDAGTCELFRTRIKGLELEAERLEQEALYDLARSAPLGEAAASAQEAAHGNIAAYESFSARPFPKPAVDVLLDAFGKIQQEPDRGRKSG
jgi:uncharacterized protein (TIGR02444 family)